MKLVLASESQFRKRAMDLLGIPYETRPARIDERAIRADNPAELTRKIAYAKANKIGAACPNSVVVSGDAVEAKGNRIFEKPRDRKQAAEFLKEFSGSHFQFVTSIAVLTTQTSRMLSTVETSDIFFRQLLDREIEQYINKYDVLSYAGAFENDAVLLFADRISGQLQPGHSATAKPPDRSATRARRRYLGLTHQPVILSAVVAREASDNAVEGSLPHL
jgi:septum formation protein